MSSSIYASAVGVGRWDSPRKRHRNPMELPWNSHESPMKIPRKFHENTTELSWGYYCTYSHMEVLYLGLSRKIHGRLNLPLPIPEEKTLIKSSHEAHPSEGVGHTGRGGCVTPPAVQLLPPDVYSRKFCATHTHTRVLNNIPVNA